MNYAMVEKVEHYGQSPTYRLISLHETEKEAVEKAGEWNPDYTESYGCCVLSYNQSASACGIVGKVIAEIPYYWTQHSDWDDVLPDYVQNTLLHKGFLKMKEENDSIDLMSSRNTEAFDKVCESVEVFINALQELNLVILRIENSSEEYLIHLEKSDDGE